MASDNYSGLVGQLEGVVYRYDTALMNYARNPGDEGAAVGVDKARSDYERASAAAAAYLWPARKPDKEQAATRFAALIGLDAGVAMHASEVALLVREPDRPEGQHAPRVPTAAEFDQLEQVRC